MSLSTFVERKDVKEYLSLNVPKPWFEVQRGDQGAAADNELRMDWNRLRLPAAVLRREAESIDRQEAPLAGGKRASSSSTAGARGRRP